MRSKLAAYKKAFNSDPEAFINGVASFCKQAEDKEGGSLWDKIWPWLLALGGGYLALNAGSIYGRYAERNNIPYGPIRGTAATLFNNMLPKDKRLDLSAKAVKKNDSTGQ